MSGNDDQLSADLASLRIQRDEGRRSAAPRQRSLWPLWAGLTVVVVALAGYTAYGRLKTSVLARAVDVTQVVMVSPDQQAQLLVATGYLVAERQATVAPKVPGRVVQLNVDAGSVVKAGDVLAVLDKADMEAALAQAEANAAAAGAQVLKARADLETAKVQAAREADLAQRGAVGSADAVDAKLRQQQAEAALAAAQSQAEAAGASVLVTRTQLGDLTIRAPFAGTVIKRTSQVGQQAGPAFGSDSGVCELADMSSIEAEIDVSEGQLGKVRPGQPAEIQLDALPDQKFAGTVDTIVPDVDRSKATATVRVKFDDIPGQAFPDMAVKVSFLEKPLAAGALNAAPKAEVPASAVVEKNGVDVVYVVGAGGRLAETPVEVAERSGDMVVFKSGPAAGTKLVAAPTADMKTGDVVKEKSAE